MNIVTKHTINISRPLEPGGEDLVETGELSRFEINAAWALGVMRVVDGGYGFVPRDWLARLRDRVARASGPDDTLPASGHLMDIVTKHALHIPRPLEPGVLHVSREYEVALHLCPCGCGEGVVTPLGTGQWALTEEGDKPTLTPSVSNVQTCRAHYFITAGKVVPA